MRLLLLLSANIILAGTFFIWQPEELIAPINSFGEGLGRTIKEYYYNKEVRIEGASRLSPDEVRKHLPLQRSNLWWLLNEDQIEKTALKISLVQSSEVSGCEDKNWGCFKVKINERRPRYIALIGQDPWLLGEDGGFIEPIKPGGSPLLKRITPDLKSAITIKGLLEKEFSPDILQSKINLISEIVRIIEDETKLKVREIDYGKDSDATLKFAHYAFKVKVSLESANLARVRDQAQRLRMILGEIRGRSNSIDEIDLAFEKVAVVKNKPSALTP